MFKVYDSLVERQRAKERSDGYFLLTMAFLTAVMWVIMALNYFVFLSVRVQGPSMQPTLYTGDVLMVNRLKSIDKGSIIVIQGEKEYWLIKRVIATEGDVIEYGADEYVYINGKKYVDEFGSAKYTGHGGTFERTVVGKNEIFYLGDNRLNSSDSRDYGTCKVSQVVGVVENWSVEHKILKKIMFWV
ncbi:MAG: signal peptidase I [Clostridia bacterium]|nr:signal peptidase I [Clostridia bacterium]